MWVFLFSEKGRRNRVMGHMGRDWEEKREGLGSGYKMNK